MNARMLIALLITLWSVVDSDKAPTNPDITCKQTELKVIDEGISRIISFTKIHRPYPDKKSSLSAWCTASKKDHANAEKTGKACLKGQANALGSILSYSVGATLRTYCNPRNKKKQNEIVYLAKCFNSEKPMHIVRDEIMFYTDILRKAAVANPPKNRIGYCCCYYFKLLDNVEQKLKPFCTEKQITRTIELVRNIIQAAIDVGCGDFTADSDACDKLPPPPTKKLNSVYPGAISFVLPLIELFSNL